MSETIGKTMSAEERDTYFAEKARKEKEAAPFIEMIEKLADNANSMSQDEKNIATSMAEAFSRQHRTLQQSSMRILAAFISEVGKTEDRFTDLRNEDAIAWARKVSELEGAMRFV